MLHVTYTLGEDAGGTRITQRDDVQPGAPRLLHPLIRIGVGRDVGGQLRRLKQLLE